MTQPISMESSDLLALEWLEPDRNPAAVYLGRLALSSRRTIRCHLDTLARIAGFPDALACPWHMMRFSHTSRLMALRRETADERGNQPSPATVVQRANARGARNRIAHLLIGLAALFGLALLIPATAAAVTILLVPDGHV